jgi:hypothetical protein
MLRRSVSRRHEPGGNKVGTWGVLEGVTLRSKRVDEGRVRATGSRWANPMSDHESEEIPVPIVWVGAEEMPILVANQMAIQHPGPDEFVLTFGQLTPPLILGSPEQRQEQLKRVTFASVQPVARVGFNRRRLQELIRILQENLARHDERLGQEGPPDG